MDFDPMLLPPVLRAAVYSQMQLGEHVRLATPQADYLSMIDHVACIVRWMVWRCRLVAS